MASLEWRRSVTSSRGTCGSAHTSKASPSQATPTPTQEVYLAPFNEKAPMLSELHHPAFVLKLRADAFVGKLEEGSMGAI